MLINFDSRPWRAAMLAAWMFIVAGNAYAQTLAYLQHQSWSTEAGLPQSSVHQILQSRDGFLWLATEGGVVRFDGVSFKTLSHETNPAFTSNDITSLAEDQDGNLWFGTADGLIEQNKDQLRHFGQSEGLPASSILSLSAAKDGSVLILTSEGLVSFEDSHFTPLQKQFPHVDRLLTEPDGSVILVTSDGVQRFRDHSVQPVPINLSLSNSVVRGIEMQPNGTRWMWSDHEVVSEFQGKQIRWQTGRDLPGARIQSVFVDHRGVAWIGTNRGLVILTASTQSPTVISALGANSILSMMEDAEGDLWIGTETSGLHTLRLRKFRDEPALADDDVSCIVQASDNSIWVGTRDDGLRRLRMRGSVSKLDRPVANSSLTSPVILALAPGWHGDVWVGTPDGLTHVEASGRSTRYTSSDSLPDDLVRSLLTAHDGSTWIGTRRGLVHLQSGRFDIETQANGLGGDLIGALFESSSHDLWIGTLSGLTRLHNGVRKNFGQADGLSSSRVTSLAEDGSHRIWVATRDAGLFLFDGNRFQKLSIKSMPSDIASLVVDFQGFLWMRTERGVVRGSTAELAQCASRDGCRASLGYYGVEDGMPSKELVADVSPSALRTSNGEVWFATRNGVAIADPATMPVNLVPPPVVIERFLADNDELPLASGMQSLPSGRARYTFEFAGLSYTVPSKVLYRFRLERFDRDWSEPTTRRNASYTNLPPGTYIFHVQAANNDGLWNDAGAQLQFRILPPFYRRWWFLFASLVALAGVSILLYRLHLRRLRHQFDAVLAERNRIAREIHDTLAQDFVGVSLQLDLVSQLLTKNSLSEAGQQLRATRSLVKAGLEEARQSIWNLRATTRRESLPARVAALAQRFPVGDLALKTKISGAYRALPLAVEDEVFRIIQEAISNVERHASATLMNVQLLYQQEKLLVTVQDNGRGFSADDRAARTGHFGLQGMRERATSLGAQFHITSSPGAGTTVELIVPDLEKVSSSSSSTPHP